MAVESKPSNWKARFGWITLTLAKIAVVILVLFGVSSGSAADGQDQEAVGSSVPLGEVLRPDGTLDLPDDFQGSLDSRGWRLARDTGEGPRFAAPGTTAFGKWADHFNLPGIQQHRVVYASGGRRRGQPLRRRRFTLPPGE